MMGVWSWQKQISQQSYELIYAKTGPTDYGSQSTPVKFCVVRHNDLSEGVIPPQDQMAALLSFQIETHRIQGLDAFSARNPW